MELEYARGNLEKFRKTRPFCRCSYRLHSGVVKSNSVVTKITREFKITYGHDASKNDADEYYSYDAYFYGGNRSFKVVNDFRQVWLHHIHHNPHHWQHWILVNDDWEEGTIALEMSGEYVIEMICDWWSFSWSKGELMEIFDWYEAHRERMILHKNTRALVEKILADMRGKLEEAHEKR